MNLQGPDRVYALKPSLQLIGEIEGAYGSLYQIAEELVEKTLPLTDMVDIVKMLYAAAGCAAELDDFLLKQPCTEMLISFLLGVLGPVEGTVTPTTKNFMDEMVMKFPDKKDKS